jgi:hypothetical protein
VVWTSAVLVVGSDGASDEWKSWAFVVHIVVTSTLLMLLLLLLYYAAANTVLANHPKGPLGVPEATPMALRGGSATPKGQNQNFLFF